MLELKGNGANLSVIASWLAAICSLPCDSRGGLGWGCLGFSVQPNAAVASHNKKQCANVRLLPLATLAPHPNPPLLPQGRERIVASAKLYRLVMPLDVRRKIPCS